MVDGDTKIIDDYVLEIDLLVLFKRMYMIYILLIYVFPKVMSCKCLGNYQWKYH